jgi:hypothetical protein
MSPEANKEECNGRETNMMKRIGLCAAGMGVLMSVGPLSIEHGFAKENDGAPKCTVATLKGRYLFAAPGVAFAPAFGLTGTETAVGNAAGFHVFNGDGTGQDYVTFTMNGIDQHVPSPAPFNYTLESDCTGTYSLLPLNHSLPTFDIFVSPNGDEMTAINTDPGNAASYAPSRRVWPK